MPTIELDEHHIYRVNGVEVPSVTQILSGVGIIANPFYSDYGADRGTKVHRATELYDRDNLDEDSLDPVLRPYVESWARFRAEKDFVPSLIEKRLYAQTYGFCGTVDRVGKFNGVETVVEIKSGSPEPWHKIQLGGYRLLLNLNSIKCVSRISVYLSDHGYKVVLHTNAHDDSLFLSALAVYNFKKNGGK